MKITKLRKLVLAAVAVCGLALGGQTIAHAAESNVPEKVTIKLHKMDNEAEKEIENTGDDLGVMEGVNPYDAKRFGSVTYRIYDMTEYLANENIVNGKTSHEDFEKARQELVDKITGKQTDPAAVLKAQRAFVKEHNLQSIAKQTLSDNSGILTFSEIENSGFYLIMETWAPVKNLTKISAPMLISLPLNDKDPVHLYPKNLIARNVDPLIHKIGLDPKNPTGNTYVPLGKVKFTLKEVGENKETRILVTDKNGDIEFGNLSVGTQYELKEVSNRKQPWYKQTNTKDTVLSLIFEVDKNGNIIKVEAQPDDTHFNIDKDKIGIKNDLILGGAEFQKIDANSEKGLKGAKFKVQKIDKKGRTFWAVFKDQTFVKWVTNKDKATELTSGEEGKFSFTGVPYVYDQRNGDVTYNLVETQAPAGYALLKSATEFKIGEDTGIQQVKNESYALPTTGGMGIWLFLLIGALLMGGAGYLYYRQKRSA
ncbi:SpaA isopeptide-forming pilin-related protein [Levilactobacillus mulengensis]|uniref:SpaA isopeptide-forming pilin-related protein n=1 Tax=Levilactobacillus mulengensis TaxID=2486025 RepID=UPI000F7B8CDA|nr:SpaA isopeptide-forming pilin-related protein [Levilactobacillus mulengensis]